MRCDRKDQLHNLFLSFFTLWICTSPTWTNLSGYSPVKQWIHWVVDSIQLLLITRFHLSHICLWFCFNKKSAHGLQQIAIWEVVKCLLKLEASVESSMELCICFRDKPLNVCVHRKCYEYAQCRNHLLQESYERWNTEYTGKILWEYLVELKVSILVPTEVCRMKKKNMAQAL